MALYVDYTRPLIEDFWTRAWWQLRKVLELAAKRGKCNEEFECMREHIFVHLSSINAMQR